MTLTVRCLPVTLFMCGDLVTGKAEALLGFGQAMNYTLKGKADKRCGVSR